VGGLLHTHIDSIRHSGTRQELRNAMRDAAAVYDVHSFTYFAAGRDRPTQSLVSAAFPRAWVQRYFAAEHFRIDPLVPILRAGTRPFVWGTTKALHDLSPRQLQMFDEAREFGVSLGFSVPMQGQLHTWFAYVSDLAEPAFVRLVERHEDDLCLMAHHFHERAAKLLLEGLPDVRESLRRAVSQFAGAAETLSEHRAIEAAQDALRQADAAQGTLLDCLEAVARQFIGRARSADQRGLLQIAVGVLEMHGREIDR
jgi:hypothetical protein